MSAVIKIETKTDEIISYNPATGDEVGRVRSLSGDDVIAAVERSREVFHKWKTTSFAERSRLVMRAREVILADIDGIAKLISRGPAPSSSAPAPVENRPVETGPRPHRCPGAFPAVRTPPSTLRPLASGTPSRRASRANCRPTPNCPECEPGQGLVGRSMGAFGLI